MSRTQRFLHQTHSNLWYHPVHLSFRRMGSPGKTILSHRVLAHGSGEHGHSGDPLHVVPSRNGVFHSAFLFPVDKRRVHVHVSLEKGWDCRFVDDDHEADDLPFEIHQSWVSGLSFNRGCIYRFAPSAPSHPLLFRGSYCYGPHVVVDDSICFCIAREQTPFHDPLNATTTLPTRLLRVNLRTGESSDVPLPVLLG